MYKGTVTPAYAALTGRCSQCSPHSVRKAAPQRKGYLRIALAELLISWENKKENQEKCRRLAAAAADSADLLIFPEMTLTGFSMNVEKIAEEREHSETMRFFMELSEESGLLIAFGMAERKEKETDTLLAENKCYLVSGKEILLEYTKLHPFSYGEEANYYRGGTALSMTEINGITLSAFICYDLRFPEPFQIVSREADFIFVIANWPKAREEHWNALLMARAIENQCYVAGINRCGNDPALSYPSASIVYDPYGSRIDRRYLPVNGKGQKKAAEIEDGDGNLYFAEIEKSIVEQYRREFPLKQDRREELYFGKQKFNLHIF